MFVVGIKHRLHICTIHLAGNERWRERVNIYMQRSVWQRLQFILMELFHEAEQEVYVCRNQGAINFWFHDRCDK